MRCQCLKHVRYGMIPAASVETVSWQSTSKHIEALQVKREGKEKERDVNDGEQDGPLIPSKLIIPRAQFIE